MAEMIPCSECGDLIRVQEDIKYQKPLCYNCTNNKKIKKVLDKQEGSGIITCIGCGREYHKSADPYANPVKCRSCYDSSGKLYWWKQ